MDDEKDSQNTSSRTKSHLDQDEEYIMSSSINEEKTMGNLTSPSLNPDKQDSTPPDPRTTSREENGKIATAQQGEDFSIFSPGQKKAMVMVASLASLFSPMATAIYYPSLDTISHDLHVSNSKINITVTIFLVIQGIAPSLVADLADRTGRRPMYIFCFLVFSSANIGLGLQNTYLALLLLRILQAAGSSGTVALSQGVVGDLITSAERGQYIAYASLGAIMGPMIAPILGGVIGQEAGWHWIFWFLLIFSGVVFVPLIMFMPETCRAVVDNGSVPPPFWSRNISDAIRHRRRAERGISKEDEEKNARFAKMYKWRTPNPVSTLKVLLDPESAILLMATGLGLGCYYAISTGASVAFSQHYGYNQIEVGLMFLPLGAGSLISAFTTGRLVDWNYRRWCTKLSVPIVKNKRHDLTNFPIERARLEVAFPIFFIGGAAVIAYGWILTADHISVAAPAVFLFITGMCLTGSFQILNVLMVDIYPGKPSIATAANNFVRCELGAVYSSALLPLVDKVGWGWAYTVLAGLYMGFAPMLLLIMTRGMKWRAVRKERADRSKAVKKEKKEKKMRGAN